MEVARWHAEIVEEPVGEGDVDFEDPSLALTARGILATRLPTGAVHAGGVASVLHMIRRTLLRRLAAEGTTVLSLLERLRRQLAFELLERSCAGTQQVAAQLGFASTRWFHRASGTGPARAPVRRWLDGKGFRR